MAASVRSKGAYGYGTTSFVAAVPTGGGAPVSGDALYIIMESSDSTTLAGTPATPADWTKLFEETQGAGATGVTTLTIFGKIAGSSEADVTVNGVLNHCSGSMVVIQGHALGAITDTQVGTGNGADSGTITMLGITTGYDDMLVLLVACTTWDFTSAAAFSGWTNTNLESITEIEDNTRNTGAGGGIGYASGVKASAGATGNSTAANPSTQWRAVHLGIRSPTLVSGAAALSGLGALSGVSLVQEMSAAAVSGLGTMTPSALVIVIDSAVLAGLGSLVASGDVLVGAVEGAAVLSGLGELAALGVDYETSAWTSSAEARTFWLGSASLSGQGALVAAGQLLVLGSSGLSGLGELVVSGDVLGVITGAAALSGAGLLSAGSLIEVRATAALSGLGSMTAAPLLIVLSGAGLSGAGTLSVDALCQVLAAAGLSGLGELVANGVVGVEIVSASAVLSGQGELSARAFRILQHLDPSGINVLRITPAWKRGSTPKSW